MDTKDMTPKARRWRTILCKLSNLTCAFDYMGMSTHIMARNCWAVLAAAGFCGLTVPRAERRDQQKGVGNGCASKQGKLQESRELSGRGLCPARAPAAMAPSAARARWLQPSGLSGGYLGVSEQETRQPCRVMHSRVAITEQICQLTKLY